MTPRCCRAAATCSASKELRLAQLTEYRAAGFAGRFFDHVVRIDEYRVEGVRQPAANGCFTGTRRADQHHVRF